MNLKSYKEKFDNMDTESKKKLIIFASGFIGVFILIIILAIVVAILNRTTSYEAVEEIMAEAAVKYYKDNPKSLPSSDAKTATVSVDTLVEGEYMKEIKKYTKDDSCTGNVVVTNTGDDYDYQAYLTCNDFKTSLLVDKIKADNEIVTANAGLYNDGDYLRFRGEYVNNYLKIEDTVYRIVKIGMDGRMYITIQEIDSDDDDLFVYWDDRYNSEEDSSCGINDYSLSRIKKSLEVYYSKMDDKIKNYLTPYNVCYGNRSIEDTNNNGQPECSRIIENANIGLLPLNDYIKASIAPACQKSTSRECKNYNYLVNDDSSWWTNTGSAQDTAKIFCVTTSGEVDTDKGYNRKVARYVVALKPKTLYKEGNGTVDKPYQIR